MDTATIAQPKEPANLTTGKPTKKPAGRLADTLEPFYKIGTMPGYLRHLRFFSPYTLASDNNPDSVAHGRDDLTLSEKVWLMYLELKKLAPDITKINCYNGKSTNPCATSSDEKSNTGAETYPLSNADFLLEVTEQPTIHAQKLTAPSSNAGSNGKYKAKFLLDDICNAMKFTVWGIAKSYWYPGAERADVMQEGFFGLYKGIRDAKLNMCENNPYALFEFFKLCIKRQIIDGVKTTTRAKHQSLNKAYSLSGPAYGSEDCDRTLGDILSSGKALPEQIVVEADELRTILEGIDFTELEANCFYLIRVLGHSYDEAAKKLNEISAQRSCYHNRMYEEREFNAKSIDNALTRGDRKILARLNELKAPEHRTKEKTMFVEHAAGSDYLLLKEYCLGRKPVATEDGKILIREKEQLFNLLTASDEELFALQSRCASRSRDYGNSYSITAMLSRLMLDLDIREYYGEKLTIEDFRPKKQTATSERLSEEAKMFSLRSQMSYDLARRLFSNNGTKVHSHKAQTIVGMSLDELLISHRNEELYTKSQTASFLGVAVSNVETELHRYNLPFVRIQQDSSTYWRCPFSTINTYLIIKAKTRTKKPVETSMNSRAA